MFVLFCFIICICLLVVVVVVVAVVVVLLESKYFPPSLKLSGVIFNTPITLV